MQKKLMLSMVVSLLLGVVACAEPLDEPAGDPAPELAPEESPSLDKIEIPAELTTQGFSCRVVAWTCTSTAQCDAMCGGPGTGVCNFSTLCCACRI
jgi:hypothetical protein